MIDTYFYKLEAVNILIYLGLVFSPGEIVVIYFFFARNDGISHRFSNYLMWSYTE